MIKVDLSRTSCKEQVLNYQQKVKDAHYKIHNKTGAGKDFLGWVEYPNTITNEDLIRIQNVATKVQNDCEVLVVIGIGGSYLGAKAAIDAINGVFNKCGLEIIYLGNTLSPYYTSQVVSYLKGKKIAINVISKSGTTIEPAIAFRIVKALAEEVWKEKANEYIFATTDKQRGALKQMSDIQGYETFVIPDDVGGRFSVFTPVGLIPLACAGVNIFEFVKGAQEATKTYNNDDLSTNPAYQYATARYLQYQRGMKVEFFIGYEPHLSYLSEWLKQLFGESEGKDGKGILPSSVCFTTDLHSMGQYCQEGSNVFFETTIKTNVYSGDVEIPELAGNLDGLNYLTGKNISYVNDIAIESTIKAHYSGNRDNIVLEMENLDERTLGNLFYFFMKACACSAYLLEINPFNQPGVEVYKANMKELLKK